MVDPSSIEPARPADPEPPEELASASQVSADRDIVAGRDIAGRDIVSQTKIVGIAPQLVLRMLIAVGLMVFFTAACFFSGGIAVGFGVFTAINRPVESSTEAARSMQSKLSQIQALPPGQPFGVVLSEEEISSYFRFVAGPQLGLEDGRVRLLGEDTLAIYGEVQALRNLPMITTYQVQRDSDETLKLTGAAIRLINLGDGSFGWVAVPARLLGPWTAQINRFIAGNYRIVQVKDVPGPQIAWAIQGVTTHPP